MFVYADGKKIEIKETNPNFDPEEVIALCKIFIDSCDTKIKESISKEDFAKALEQRTIKTCYEAFLLLLTDRFVYYDILHLWGIL